ncbi:hypothetical protein EBZ37_11185, partial [bacterium]|nr:hypothetical protein [bacterium]
DCFYFLLGIQLALSWENVDPETWGEGADAILGNTDLSVRPAYQRPHNFASSLRSSSIAGDSKEGIRKRRFSKRASRITRFSTYFRRSTLGGEGVQKLGESLRKRLTLGGASSYALFGDTFQSSNQGETASQVSSEHGDLESKVSDEDDASEFYDTTSDEDSYQSDQELSSPDTSDSEGEKERKRQVTMTREKATGKREGGRLPIVSYADLYKAEITDLQQKLVGLGVDPNASSFDLEKAVEWMIKFQHLTDQPNQTLSTSSHQFRYLLKRAYLHYLQCWPLYGYHFTEAVLLLDEHGRRDVLVGISPSGILLLDPDNWTKVMHSSLSDIESASYNPGETEDNESFSERDTESSPHSSVTGSSRLSDSPDDATSNSMFSTPESDSRFSTPESNKSRGSSLSGGSSSGKGRRSKRKGPRVSAMEKLPTIRDDDEESDPPSDSELPEDDPPGSSDFSDEEPPEDSDNEDSLGSPPGSEELPSEEDGSEPPSPSDESSRSSASNARGGKRKSLKSTSSRSSSVSDSSSYSSSSR